MGDKSPKSKERGQRQKSAAKATDVARAASKQASRACFRRFRRRRNADAYDDHQQQDAAAPERPLARRQDVASRAGKSGEIAAQANGHPQLKKLVDAGEIEIVEDGLRATGEFRGGKSGRASTGHTSGAGGRRSGDR